MNATLEQADPHAIALSLREQIEQVRRLMSEHPCELWYAAAAKHIDAAIQNLERIEETGDARTPEH